MPYNRSAVTVGYGEVFAKHPHFVFRGVFRNDTKSSISVASNLGHAPPNSSARLIHSWAMLP